MIMADEQVLTIRQLLTVELTEVAIWLMYAAGASVAGVMLTLSLGWAITTVRGWVL